MLPLPGLVTMVAEDQLQRVHQIGFRLFDGFALREDIRQFLKGGSITTFWGNLINGCELDVQGLETHGKGNLVHGRRFFQFKLPMGQ